MADDPYHHLCVEDYERVFVNGAFVGGHRGGSTPFFVELEDALRPGENRLLIQVENRRRSDRVPMHHTDWFNYGGLYRDVELVVVPRLFVRHFHIALVPRSSFARIGGTVELSTAADAEAVLEIPELGVRASVAIVAGRGAFDVAATPELWSPTHPRLYDVTLTCGEDQVSERVGFREIRRDGLDLLLNGEPLWLRGIGCHEDDVHGGKCTSDADIRRRIAHALELGANCMRLSHYPHHERARSSPTRPGCCSPRRSRSTGRSSSRTKTPWPTRRTSSSR